MRKTVAGFANGELEHELLRDFRVDSSVLCRSVMAPPWGFGVANRDVGSFHMVLEGQGWLEVEGVEDLLEVGTNDLAVLPRGNAHWVKDSPSTTAPALTTILAHHDVVDGELRFGGDEGPPAEIVCGVFALEDARSAPWLRYLPPVMLSRSEPVRSDWRAPVAHALRDEARAPTKGGAALVNRLLESLLADAIRKELVGAVSEETMPSAVVRDERIGRVLSRLHDDLSAPWKVDAMARVAAMSRSAFAERFRSIVGDTPSSYLGHLRLMRAARLLRSTDTTVVEVARSVGYRSEEALSRAFKRQYGVAPGTARRQNVPESRLESVPK